MDKRARTDFTQNLEAVARGVRRLEEVRDPILREAIAAALRLRDREARLDPASRARMRNTVLAALAPRAPSAADRTYGAFAILGSPAPLLVRGLALAVAFAGLLAGATFASADALPDDPFYGFKVAGEQVRLAVAAGAEDRAAVELSIAEHRLDEAERLAVAGRADDAIIATAGYGESIANAAADLAGLDPDDNDEAIVLVAQLQQRLVAGQERVAVTAARLAADPRTLASAEVLATVSATPAPGLRSAAGRIADQGAEVASRVATVADDRAREAEPRRTGAPQPTERRSTGGAVRPSETPEPTASALPTRATLSPRTSLPEPAHRIASAPPDPSAAREAATRAKHAADEAKKAAEKAKQAASRTPSPKPTRR